MDLNQLVGPLLQGGNPWLILAGAVIVTLWQRFAPKAPPTPTPGTPAGRPLLDVLTRLLPGRAAGKPPQLADMQIAELLTARAALDAHLGERAAQADAIRAALAPEPGRPV